MQKIYSALSTLALTIWLGSLWAVGYLAVPVLFHAQADKQLAGMLAGEMLGAVGYVGLVCGTLLLLQGFFTPSDMQNNSARKNELGLIAAMLLIGVVIQFGIAPVMADLKIQARPEDVMHSAYAAKFKTLHGASSILYLLESLLGLYLLLSKNRGK